MPMRRPMSRGEAKRNFRRGAKVNGRNFATAMRGGYRL